MPCPHTVARRKRRCAWNFTPSKRLRGSSRGEKGRKRVSSQNWLNFSDFLQPARARSDQRTCTHMVLSSSTSAHREFHVGYAPLLCHTCKVCPPTMPCEQGSSFLPYLLRIHHAWRSAKKAFSSDRLEGITMPVTFTTSGGLSAKLDLYGNPYN